MPVILVDRVVDKKIIIAKWRRRRRGTKGRWTKRNHLIYLPNLI
jgi:hypothetical protein